MKQSLFSITTFISTILTLLSSCNQTPTDKLFTRLPSSHTHIKFKNIIQESEGFNVLEYGYLYNGGGVAIGDINNDSLPDIYFTGNLVSNKLYLNKGDFSFEDITENAGVKADDAWNTGVTMADVNGDGYLDIYVCRSADTRSASRRNLLFINNGAASGKDLTFTEKAAEYGIDDPAYSTQAAFFDYDKDGDLDLYLLNHSTQEYAGFNKLTERYKNVMNPQLGDKLYRNDSPPLSPPGGGQRGGTIFTDVSQEAGIIQNVLGFGLGVIVTDFNQDHWPDIYVANDYNEEDYFYINQQDGTFREALDANFGHVSLFSMGCDGADINNDLRPDIVTLDMLPEDNTRLKMSIGPENYDKYNQLISSGFYPQTMRNMLQLNVGSSPRVGKQKGEVHFSEIGELSNIASTDWSWAALLADFNNDGWKDLFVSNGYMRNYLDMDFLTYVVNEKVKSQQENKEVAVMEIIEKMPSIEVENYMYNNNKDLTFSKVTEAWGLGGASVSNGAAYADLDNDGDLDLIVNNVNEEAYIYRNNGELHNQNHYLKVHLEGKGKNTFGIGSKVYIFADGQQQYQECIPVRGFQSSMPSELVFGLGNATQIDSLQVIWPDSAAQTLHDISVNQTLTLKQEKAVIKNGSHTKPIQTIFQEADTNFGIDYQHQENDYLDFKRDRMLPQGISNLGPKIAKGDINKDGLEDVFIGGAKGSSGKLYQQTQNGEFVDISGNSFVQHKESEDTDAVFFDADGDQDIDLYVVSGGSDFSENSPDLQDRLYLNDGKGNFTSTTSALPAMYTSGSSVTTADVDKDGDIDLFVGGRLIPGKYPLSPRSYLLKNNGNGKFEDATKALCPDLLHPGMVSDVVFTDLNADNLPDLVVVGEWTDIGIYLNNEIEGFIKNEAAALTATTGWWHSIHTNDFDNDGDTDLVLGNFGNNNPYQPTSEQPARLVYKDFDNNGSVDPIFTYFLDGKEVFAYSRDELIGQIASKKKNFPDYASFAQASISNYFTEEELLNADTLVATTFETIYLQNEGNGNFTIIKLPIEAQFAPVYAIAFDDFNSDGNMDIILAGNQSVTRVSTGKFDANYGIVLAGDGAGSFKPISTSITGMILKGDVRDIQPIKISGENYYLFSKNKKEVKLYHIHNR